MTQQTELQSSVFDIEIDDANIALISINVKDGKSNWLPESFFEDLNTVIDSLEAQQVRGMIITSAKKKCFVKGFKLDVFQKMSNQETMEYSQFAQETLERLSRLPIPVIAAVNGDCFGVGLELILACDARVVSDKKNISFAMPQVRSGILPFAGGIHRLSRVVGLRQATPILLSGSKISEAEALRISLINKIVPASNLLDSAYHLLYQREKGNIESTPYKSSKLGKFAKKLEQNHFFRNKYLERAENKVWLKEFGHYPAIKEISTILRITNLDESLQAAREALPRLFNTEQSQVLIKLKQTERAMKVQYRNLSGKVRDIRQVSILGSGYMGAGIAYLTANNAGVPVRIKDIHPAEIQKALRTCYKLMQEEVFEKEMTRGEMIQKMNLISGSDKLVVTPKTDFIIEAVYEDLALKQKMLKESGQYYDKKTVFATNTSTCHIKDIASVANRPETVIGFHYISPVETRKMVEIIPHETTSEHTIATAIHFVIQQGKLPMLVADKQGFFINRVLTPYLQEAIQCVVDGEAIEFIDRSLEEFGFQIGPLAMVDEMGIDVMVKSNPALIEQLGERFTLPSAVDLLTENDRKGRKNKRGFYLYDSSLNRTKEDESIYHVMEVIPRNDLEGEEIVRRCLLRMINEACWCLQDEVITSTDEGNVASVNAMFFPEFRGGIYAYIEKIGAKNIVAELRKHTKLYGSRFEPCDWLVERAEQE